MDKIAAVINFCSNEARFIRPCIEEARLFSSQVIIPVADHFFNGEREDEEKIEQIAAAFPDCLFVLYPFIPHKIPPSIFAKVAPANFWHSLSRLVAVSLLDENIDTLLFLDADEVADGKRFLSWVKGDRHPPYTVLKLANYWYFREPTFRATQIEDSVLLVQKNLLTADLLLHEEERDALFSLLPGPKRGRVLGLDGAPMFHHFSWVRSEGEMRKKVSSWGHKKERPWEELVAEEFSRPFQGVDFVHGYSYTQVKEPFSLPPTPTFPRIGPPQIVRLTEKELLALIWRAYPSFLHRLKRLFF